MRSLRALTASALFALVGCFPHAASVSGPSSSPAPAQTAVPARASTAAPHASAASISTAPVYIIRSSAPAKTVPESPVPLPTVTPYRVIGSAAHLPVIPSVAPKAQSRGTEAIDNEPHIFAIHLSTLEIRSGETVSGYVTTSDNVSAVDIHISAWSMPVPKSHAGLFRASGAIPDLPFFLKGKYTLQVIARVGNGPTTERDIPISLR